MRIGGLLVLVLGTQALGWASSRPAPEVVLDVVVQDSAGRPVDTLGPDDFSVRNAAGDPIPVSAVRFIRATGAAPADAASGAAPDDEARVSEMSRVVAIFLDEYHTTPGPGAERARAVLARFVQDDLGPADLLVVLRPLDSLLQIRLTRDRDAAVQAIEAFDPRRGDFLPRSTTEFSLMAGAPARAAAMRAQVTASALGALVSALSRFGAGRKTLIVLSEGFGRTGRQTESHVLPTIESMLRAANQAQVAVYPMDPRRDPAAPASDLGPDVDASTDRAARDASLAQRLADETSGRRVGPGDDLTAGLKRALGDASGYYLLTLGWPDARLDDHVHPRQVAVRRAGVTTRARHGYWVPPLATPPATPAPRVVSRVSRLPRRQSPLIEPWFGMSRASDGATRISFVWEPSLRVNPDRLARATPARVALTVTTLDGVPVFEGEVLPSNLGAGGAGGAQALFEQPPGHLVVQMAIEDQDARVLDRDVRDLVVGEFDGPVAMGSPEVLRARNAREFRALVADRSAAPVASRQFSRADRLLVRVPLFSDGATPLLTARLLSGVGRAMRELSVIAPREPDAPFLVDVPLAALATGTYAVELTARTPRTEVRQQLLLRVTP